MSSPFILAPWEVGPGGHMGRRLGEVEIEIEAPKTSPFRGTLLVSRMKSHFCPFGSLWFRLRNSDDEGNFVVVTHAAARPYRFAPIAYYLEGRSMEEELQSALEENRWGRVYFLNGSGSLVEENKAAAGHLLVAANGFGTWSGFGPTNYFTHNSLYPSPDYNFPFIWSQNAQPETLARTSSIEFFDKVASKFWDSNENAVFARQWINCSANERIACGIAFEHGSLLEFESTLQLALNSDIDLWQQNEWLRWNLTLNVPKHNHTASRALEFFKEMAALDKTNPKYTMLASVSLNERHINITGEPRRKTTTKRLSAWKRVLMEHFNPHSAATLGTHPCINDWLIDVGSQTQQALLERPSGHQMLEARKCLKEWAEKELNPQLWTQLERFER